MLCGLQVCAMAEAMLIGKKSSNYFKTNILFLDKSREGNYKRIDVISFAHLGDGKILGLLTNVTDDYHFRPVHWTGALDRCIGPVY